MLRPRFLTKFRSTIIIYIVSIKIACRPVCKIAHQVLVEGTVNKEGGGGGKIMIGFRLIPCPDNQKKFIKSRVQLIERSKIVVLMGKITVQ